MDLPAGTLTAALPVTAPLRLAVAATWAGHATPLSVYFSPKTVEATLSRVYRKVGVRSRTELARRLAADRPGEIV